MTEWLPEFLQDKTYDARYVRYMLQDLGGTTEGITTVGGLAVSQRAAGGAGMFVDIAAGSCFVQGDDLANYQGLYHYVSDALQTKAIAPNSSGSTRVDTAVVHIYDSVAVGGSEDDGHVEIVTGVPGAGASPLGKTQLPLADITVANGAGSIVNANITDRRVLSVEDVRRSGAMPRAAVWHSVDQSIVTSPSQSPFPGGRLAFNSTRYDQGGSAAFHSNVTNNSRITIPEPGFYLVTFSGRWAASTTGERRADILINGTTNSLQSHTFTAGSAGSNLRTHLLVLQRPFVAGDYIEVGVTQDSGGALSLQSVGSPAEISPELRIAMLSRS